MTNIASMEYAVEVRDVQGFVRQIDVFATYEEAEAFVNACDEDILYSGEYLCIILIKYDENGNEIGITTQN